MYIIRPVQISDIDGIYKLAKSTVSGGITSLPQHRGLLEKKIERATSPFKSLPNIEETSTYLFVLEDTATGTIGGVSAIRSTIGISYPCFFYKIENEKWVCPSLCNGSSHRLILSPDKCTDGPTEMCSLFLHKDHRHGGLGKLLAWCRFLFIAAHPSRFMDTTIAALRGVIDVEGNSPFWEAVGRRFYDVPYRDLITQLQHDPRIMEELIPHHPLYVELLPQTAKRVIAIPHPNSEPAYKMLIAQGFSVGYQIDPFDAGPVMECPTASIEAVRNSTCVKTAIVDERSREGTAMLIINDQVEEFRAIIGDIEVDRDGNGRISKALADQLLLNEGDELRFLSLGEGYGR